MMMMMRMRSGLLGSLVLMAALRGMPSAQNYSLSTVELGSTMGRVNTVIDGEGGDELTTSISVNDEDTEEAKARAYFKAYVIDRRNNLYVYEMFSAVLCPVGYVLNSLSFMVFWRMKQRQRQAVILVMMALTVVDPIATIINTDYVISANSGYSWQQNTDAGCKIINYLATVGRDCSNAFCVLIALERFISVYFPLKVALWCTKRRVMVATGMLTFVFSALETYRLFGFEKQSNYGVDYCTYNNQRQLLTKEMMLAVTRCIGFLIPWCGVGVLNFLIIIKLRKWRIKRQKLGAKEEGNNQSLTLMFLAMSLFSLGTNILDLVNVITFLSSGKNYISSYDQYVISSVLVLCNHTCNFIFYAMAGDTFRRTLLFMLTCGRVAEDERSVYSQSLRSKGASVRGTTSGSVVVKATQGTDQQDNTTATGDSPVTSGTH